MFTRILGAPVLLAAAVGVPYLASQGVQLDRFWDRASSSAASDSSDGIPIETPSAGAADAQRKRWELPPQGPGSELYPTTTPLEGVPSISLHEVFRFDITKDWVYQRWARKSTALAELGLFGVRVPLVTGTELYDLAGSLTYFFDHTGALQRISFQGNTGDTTQLVALVTQRYGLEWQRTPIVGEQLLQVRSGDNVYSELRTQPAAVLWSSSPHNSFQVEMELQRPGTTVALPSRPLPTPVAQSVSPTPSAAEPSTAPPTPKEKAAETKERLNLLFPRSRLPNPQVQSLDKKNRY